MYYHSEIVAFFMMTNDFLEKIGSISANCDLVPLSDQDQSGQNTLLKVNANDHSWLD